MRDVTIYAQVEAEVLARGGLGADLMVFNADDSNDLPDWAGALTRRGA
jgi:hypothetical protein